VENFGGANKTKGEGEEDLTLLSMIFPFGGNLLCAFGRCQPTSKSGKFSKKPSRQKGVATPWQRPFDSNGRRSLWETPWPIPKYIKRLRAVQEFCHV
jgi:hypothetical protein